MAADLRLDNRDEMLARIGTAPQEAAVWADLRVLLAAWEKLGDRALAAVVWSPAVAIWEPDRRIFDACPRPSRAECFDVASLRAVFAFASMPAGLFASNGVPRQLNEEKFADFLVLNHADYATTIYRDVFRVPPAHVLQVSVNSAAGGSGSFGRPPLSSRSGYLPIKRRRGPAQPSRSGGTPPIGAASTRSAAWSPAGWILSSVCALAARALGEQNSGLPPLPVCRGTALAGIYRPEHMLTKPLLEAIAERWETSMSSMCATIWRCSPRSSDFCGYGRTGAQSGQFLTGCVGNSAPRTVARPPRVAWRPVRQPHHKRRLAQTAAHLKQDGLAYRPAAVAPVLPLHRAIPPRQRYVAN